MYDSVHEVSKYFNFSFREYHGRLLGLSIFFAGGIPIEDCLAGLLHSLGSCPGITITSGGKDDILNYYIS
jgi:hypothetical protein